MFVFYVWERAVSGAPEALIWQRLYFDDGWQAFFDVFNSIPLALLGLLAAWQARRAGLQVFFASWILHCLLDLPFHREDGHRHLLPLSDWRFMSPVSYWDPAYHGALFAAAETALVLGGSLVLWRRYASPLGRAALVAASALSVAAWTYFQLAGGL